MAYRSFESLEVWQRACRIAVRVYQVLRDCRDYGIRDQMQRSAVSIASNIAEGAERDSRNDFVRFLRIAKGSSAELRTQAYIANMAGIISGSVSDELDRELMSISSMLHRLILAIQRKEKLAARKYQAHDT